MDNYKKVILEKSNANFLSSIIHLKYRDILIIGFLKKTFCNNPESLKIDLTRFIIDFGTKFLQKKKNTQTTYYQYS